VKSAKNCNEHNSEPSAEHFTKVVDSVEGCRSLSAVQQRSALEQNHAMLAQRPSPYSHIIIKSPASASAAAVAVIIVHSHEMIYDCLRLRPRLQLQLHDFSYSSNSKSHDAL